MNDLIENYEIILAHLKANCNDRFTEPSRSIESFRQIRTPKLSNLELVAMNLTAEYMSINKELQPVVHLKKDCPCDQIIVYLIEYKSVKYHERCY